MVASSLLVMRPSSGSMGGIVLNKPVVGALLVSPTGGACVRLAAPHTLAHRLFLSCESLSKLKRQTLVHDTLSAASSLRPTPLAH